MTPMHFSSSSTTGSPDTNSKLWFISSSVCSGLTLRICLDITVSRVDVGFTCGKITKPTPVERSNRHHSTKEERGSTRDTLSLIICFSRYTRRSSKLRSEKFTGHSPEMMPSGYSSRDGRTSSVKEAEAENIWMFRFH